MAEGDQVLYRWGTERESAGRLARKAAEAEERIGLHGVSVSGSVPDVPSSSAPRKAVEEFFEVQPTPTRRDPLRQKLILPKPVTREVADIFNRVFGRGR